MTMQTGKIRAGGSLSAPAHIAGGEIRTLRAGFIPLVDASVLIAAAEFGFAKAEGLRLDLVKDVSWANVRDRLAFRQFDIAHMLAPMPVASVLGLGSNPSPTITPFSLGRGGNAITLSIRLYERMRAMADLVETTDALANAQALAAVVRDMKSRGEPPLTLAMPYIFSSHNYELRYWLAAGGIDPDYDVKLVIVPPPLTSDALITGAIDGFCVGAPWNMVASGCGAGRIVAAKHDIWPASPEKVVGMRPEWVETQPETVFRLIVALDEAARWCDNAENHDALAETLADDRYLGVPREIVRNVLAGTFNLDAQGNQRVIESYFNFHTGFANYPRPHDAMWIYSQMVRWGQVGASRSAELKVATSYRPDLYCSALGIDEPPLAPDLDALDHFMDNRIFNPLDIPSYVQGFDVRREVFTGTVASGD